jgi:MFS family permease
VTLALLAERTFHGSAGTYTLLFSTMSVGSMVGGLAVARRSVVTIAMLVKAGLGLFAAMGALAVAPTLWLAVLAAVPVGFTSIFLVSGSNAVVQLEAEPTMRGRVLALYGMLFLGSTPIGGPIMGWVSDVASPRAAVAVGAVATGLAALWTARNVRRSAGRPVPVVDEPVAEPTPVAA